jgi:8-oxo-dGTP pyrophosphatase MutT (NUDIX family)
VAQRIPTTKIVTKLTIARIAKVNLPIGISQLQHTALSSAVCATFKLIRSSSWENGLPAMTIRTLSSREIYRNHWLRLREDKIERNNGTKGIYGVIDKDDCAVIIPIDGDTIYLVEQFRYTIQQRALELPQGGWETPEVDPEELARGELREETGLVASSMTYLGTMWIAYGFARQKQHVFLATGLVQAEIDPDPEEHDLVLHTLSIAQFEGKLLDGTSQDVCTLAAWGLYKVWREQRSKS